MRWRSPLTAVQLSAGVRPPAIPPHWGDASVKRPAGYSGNPLATKLGLKQGFRISLSRDPRHYSSLLGQLPVGTKRLAPGATNLDFLHIFVTSSAELLHDLPRAS
jgi:hypothetical protein